MPLVPEDVSREEERGDVRNTSATRRPCWRWAARARWLSSSSIYADTIDPTASERWRARRNARLL